ncbi:MAG: hypothetical protein WD934_05265 [Gemmatimonadales bacterium]
MTFSPELARRLHQALGPEATGDLLSWMHDMDAHRGEQRDQFRADLAEMRQEMHAGFATVREEMSARLAGLRDEMNTRLTGLRDEMNTRFTGLRDEMNTRFTVTDATIAALREEMRVGFATMDARIERRFGDLIKWSFVFWCSAVGAVALLAKALG